MNRRDFLKSLSMIPGVVPLLPVMGKGLLTSEPEVIEKPTPKKLDPWHIPKGTVMSASGCFLMKKD